MPEPIRILHVFSRMGRGGAELRTLEILRHVDRRQYQFHCCALSGLRGELDYEIRALGGEVYLLRRGLGFAGRFRRLLFTERFDVVHSHVLYYAGFLLRLAAQCAVPMRVAFFRSSQDGRGSGPARSMYRRLMRHWIDRYATSIEAVSEGVMDTVWQPRWRDDPRCQVIYDGIDPAPFEEAIDREAVRREFGIPPGGGLYVHVGRMSKPKNHLRLLDIFAQLVRQQPAARLLLVGRGGNEIEQAVRGRIAARGLGGRVVLCQERSDVPRLLAAADALLLPSLWEGLPGAVLEACAAGTPVLASDLPGVREIAAHLPQIRYLSLETTDAVWAQALGELAARPDTEAARRQARRAFAASPFTVERCAKQHCRVWQGLFGPSTGLPRAAPMAA